MPRIRKSSVRAAAALCLAALLLGAVPSAALAEPDLLLESRGRAPATLAPGTTSTWILGITTKEVRLNDLSLHLSAAGSLPDAADHGPEDLLTVEVTACPGRWSAGHCPAGPQEVIPRTPLGSVDGTVHSLDVPDGGIPAGVELLAAVTLSPAAGNTVQGLSVKLTARVDAAGEPLAQQPMQVPDGGLPPGGALADTGLRLGGLALLGAAAVVAGILTTAWARRTTAARNTAAQAAERKART